ncbi:MAG: alpha/beta hydrolase [Chloroflexi bacterium]|nr:alpha/beta hydrolase [Chloroflexota bacterium]
MQRLISRLVVINAVICAIFGILFALPVNRPEIGLIIGLLFGILNGLLIESVFRRWKGRWLYQRRLLVLVLLEVVLLLFLIFPAYIAYLSLRPSRVPVAALPTDLLDSAEDVLLQTQDGTSLSGWYLPSTNGAAILALHGFGGNRLEVLPHARLLNQQGYGVLLMDMRAHGASGGEIFADGWNAVGDAHVMVDYLRARPQVNRIGALGLSSGAISIIHAGAAIDSIEAFVAEGTGVAAVEDLLDPLIPHPAIAWLLVPDYWMSFRFTALYTGLAPMPPLREQVGHIAPRPILLIAGAESMWEPELAAKYAHSAGASADVWVIPNAGHIAGISSAPEEYAERVLGFFGAALLTQ